MLLGRLVCRSLACHRSLKRQGRSLACRSAAMQPDSMQPAAVQPTSMPVLATPSIMLVRPNQMGYLTGAPSAFSTQGTQFPCMSNPSWEVS